MSLLASQVRTALVYGTTHPRTITTVAHAPPAPSPWTHTTVKGTKCVAQQDLEQEWFWPSGTHKCYSLPANDSLTTLQHNVSLQNIVFAFQVPVLCCSVDAVGSFSSSKSDVLFFFAPCADSNFPGILIVLKMWSIICIQRNNFPFWHM